MEVLSPSTAYYDLVHKKAVYESSGVREYWIIDPKEHSVEVFLNEESGFQSVAKAVSTGTAASRIIAGFAVNLAELFTMP
jgi:Uma2 family endonuclease